MSGRPQSRGGMGMPGPIPASRMQSRGMRLGTAQKGAAGGAGLQSVGLSTHVVVDNRPVTRQGLTGMHSGKPLGPGRQIADDRYFLTELRTRIADITTEMENMKKEEITIKENNAKYQQHERTYEKTIKEVRNLEGELADFNLALDKLRTNTDVQDIREMYVRLQQRNDYERKQVDEIFLKTQTMNKKTQQVNESIQDIYNQATENMGQLGEAVQQEYVDLQKEKVAIQGQVEEKEDKIAELDSKINRNQQLLKSQEYKTHLKGLELQKKRKSLMAKIEELKTETEENLNPEQVKDRLLEKMKVVNSENEEREKRKEMMEANVDRLQGELAKSEQQLAEAKKHAQYAKKYEAVYERDRKMQEAIDEFPTVIKAEQANTKKLRSTVVALLKHISKGIKASQNLPDAEKLSEMKKELTFKDKSMQNSKDTLELLNQELAKRKQELDKINQLDLKINRESKSLTVKMEDMNNKMAAFKSEDELKEEAAQLKQQLQVDKQRTKKLKDAIKSQVEIEAAGFDGVKREMAGNETLKRIENLEQKLKTYSQTVFSLDEFIKGRKRESDYHGILNQLQEMSSKINANIINNLANSQTRAGQP